MGSYTKEELQAMNMTALKELPESEGGRRLKKDDLVAYILGDEAAKAEDAAAEEAAGPGPMRARLAP